MACVCYTESGSRMAGVRKSIHPPWYARAEFIGTAKAKMRKKKPWRRKNWICEDQITPYTPLHLQCIHGPWILWKWKKEGVFNYSVIERKLNDVSITIYIGADYSKDSVRPNNYSDSATVTSTQEQI